ncbi:hypothetical protein [Nocardia sp. NPDC057227]|uniref:hypothetical protein n=1 Tax=Nocardia sp. NPDC057227 TaxID=3346056 RepID=UPI00363C807B
MDDDEHGWTRLAGAAPAENEAGEPPWAGIPRLGLMQKRVLEFLDSEMAWSIDDVAFTIWTEERDFASHTDLRSAYRCLKRLERRGLARCWRTWIREVGYVTVWRSMVDPDRVVLDPGG